VGHALNNDVRTHLFSAETRRFRPIDKTLTHSYLSGTTSLADPAGGFMLPAVFQSETATFKAHRGGDRIRVMRNR